MTDTAADRARIEEAREDWGVDLGDCFCHGCSTRRDLLRMAEDGIAAREALARVEALCDDADEEHTHDLAVSPGEPECPFCWVLDIRRAITGEA